MNIRIFLYFLVIFFTVSPLFPSNKPLHPIDVLSAFGSNYWLNHSADDFLEESVIKRDLSKKPTFSQDLLSKIITAGLATTASLAIKTLLWDKYHGILYGDGTPNSGPELLNCAWELGGSFAFAVLAYQAAKNSFIPDICAHAKKLTKSSDSAIK